MGIRDLAKIEVYVRAIPARRRPAGHLL